MVINNSNETKSDTMLKKVVNVLLLLLIGILSFLGTQMYDQVNNKIPAQFELYVKKTDIDSQFSHVNRNLEYLTEKIDEINCFLRDNPIPKERIDSFYNVEPPKLDYGDKNAKR